MTITLATYLSRRSTEICDSNGCTGEGEHYCGSYAYIAIDSHFVTPIRLKLLDICPPDFFAGDPDGSYAAVPLPWHGTDEELTAEVLREIEDWEAQR
jgi:hypothetical protein